MKKFIIIGVMLLAGCDSYDATPRTRQEAFNKCITQASYRSANDCAEAVNSIYDNAPNK